MKTTVIFGVLAFLSCALLRVDGGLSSGEMPPSSEYVSDEELVKTYLQPDDIGRDRKYDNLSHKHPYLCTRDCSKFPKGRLCYYIFNVEQYATMGPACRKCSTGNITDCHRRQCIQADGIERMAISINRMIPGPTIDVCYGDRIVVDVINKLATSAVTIHWHGVLQKDTPWMDGVPFVTQCPINPGSRFRYNFPANTNGSLFYHAHMAHLHANGLYGALIVRTPTNTWDPNDKHHEYDVPSHTVIISDWTHFPSEVFSPGYFRNESHIGDKPDVHLINGRGSYNDSRTTTNVAPAEFHLKCGSKYRFRIIAATTSTCSFKFGIHGHSLKVVALDGYPCEAFNVSTLVMSSGQRTDVILTPEKGQSCSNSSFLMVVKGMDSCNTSTNAQIGHVIYDNTSSPPDMPPMLSRVYDKPPFLNNHNLRCNHSDNVCADTKPPPSDFMYAVSYENEPANHTFIIQPGFHLYTADELFETNTYSPFYVPFGPNGTFAATLNNVTGLLPPVPLLTQEKNVPSDIPVCHAYCQNRSEPFCRCMNILEVRLNSRVEVQFERGIIHPIHLHGHHFVVMKSNNISTFDIAPGTIQRDVVHVPLDGVARVRFKADNPGYWIMHCHFSPHFDGGMYLIFKVGNSSDFKPPPPDFPRCGDFRSPVERF